MKQKRLTKTSALTLSKDIRQKCNIRPGDVVDIGVTKSKEIVIKKHSLSCICCAGVDGVIVYKGIEICKNCIKGAYSYVRN